MTRLAGGFLALLLGLVPIVNDTCGLGCDIGRPAPIRAAAADASCPLHKPHRAPAQPDRCGHDHTVGRAGIVRTVVAAPALDPTHASLVVHASAHAPDSRRAIASDARIRFRRLIPTPRTAAVLRI